MKKICMVAYTYYLCDPRVRREAEALVEQGFSVDFFALRKRGQLKSEVVNGVNLYRLPLSKYRGSSLIKYAFMYLLFFALSFVVVTKFYLKRRYQIIQCHTIPDFVVFSGIISRMCGAKLVLDMHEIMPEFFVSKFGVMRSQYFIKILKLIEKISVRFSDAVIVVNDPIKRLLLTRCKPRSDVTVVMNCADETIFSSGRFGCSVNDNGFTIMYHGTLTSVYGLELAIRAIPKIKGEIPHLKFWIFGYELEARNLKKLADKLRVSDIVIFMGLIPLEEIPKYIEQADIGVLTTVRDEFIDLSFSNKLAEYVIMKTPVVATRLSSTLEYFPEDAISYFESGEVDALTSKILELYKNPQKRLLQAEKAFQHYQKIRWPVMKKRYVELINSLVGR